jgi:hypothetical protein
MPFLIIHLTTKCQNILIDSKRYLIFPSEVINCVFKVRQFDVGHFVPIVEMFCVVGSSDVDTDER